MKGFFPMKITAFSDSSLGGDDADRRSPTRQDGSVPSDSSLAHQRWEDEGGACPPPAKFPDRCAGAFISPTENKSDPLELITLPFSEYSAVFPDRMSNLQARLHASSKKPTGRYLVVDVSRIQYASALLIEMLRVTARAMIQEGRCLVLIGNLYGLVIRSGLAELCLTVDTFEAAQALCKNCEDN